MFGDNKQLHPKRLPDIEEEEVDDDMQILRKYKSEIKTEEKRNNMLADNNSPKSNNSPQHYNLNRYNSTTSFKSQKSDVPIDQYFDIIFGPYFKDNPTKQIDKRIFAVGKFQNFNSKFQHYI